MVHRLLVLVTKKWLSVPQTAVQIRSPPFPFVGCDAILLILPSLRTYINIYVRNVVAPPCQIEWTEWRGTLARLLFSPFYLFFFLKREHSCARVYKRTGLKKWQEAKRCLKHLFLSVSVRLQNNKNLPACFLSILIAHCTAFYSCSCK